MALVWEVQPGAARRGAKPETVVVALSQSENVARTAARRCKVHVKLGITIVDAIAMICCFLFRTLRGVIYYVTPLCSTQKSEDPRSTHRCPFLVTPFFAFDCFLSDSTVRVLVTVRAA